MVTFDGSDATTYDEVPSTCSIHHEKDHHFVIMKLLFPLGTSRTEGRLLIDKLGMKWIKLPDTLKGLVAPHPFGYGCGTVYNAGGLRVYHEDLTEEKYSFERWPLYCRPRVGDWFCGGPGDCTGSGEHGMFHPMLPMTLGGKAFRNPGEKFFDDDEDPPTPLEELDEHLCSQAFYVARSTQKITLDFLQGPYFHHVIKDPHPNDRRLFHDYMFLHRMTGPSGATHQYPQDYKLKD